MVDMVASSIVTSVGMHTQSDGMTFGQLTEYSLRVGIERLYIFMSEYFLL
jgi:hypothetical protein